MDLDDASRIGHYRLLFKLGQGAMGDVYLALADNPVGFAKLSVLKILRRHLSDDPDFVGMFLEEGRLALRLAHPNIVQTYDVESIDGRHFLAMEYLEGQTLSAVLNRMGRDNPLFDFAVQAHILIEVLAAMQYAHEYLDYDGSPLPIIHRDLSPPNIFVTYDGRVKVLDFGIAKALDSSIDTKTGLILGKTT
jgi:serine/threonine-protein kinase